MGRPVFEEQSAWAGEGQARSERRDWSSLPGGAASGRATSTAFAGNGSALWEAAHTLPRGGNGLATSFFARILSLADRVRQLEGAGNPGNANTLLGAGSNYFAQGMPGNGEAANGAGEVTAAARASGASEHPLRRQLRASLRGEDLAHRNVERGPRHVVAGVRGQPWTLGGPGRRRRWADLEAEEGAEEEQGMPGPRDHLNRLQARVTQLRNQRLEEFQQGGAAGPQPSMTQRPRMVTTSGGASTIVTSQPTYSGATPPSMGLGNLSLQDRRTLRHAQDLTQDTDAHIDQFLENFILGQLVPRAENAAASAAATAGVGSGGGPSRGAGNPFQGDVRGGMRDGAGPSTIPLYHRNSISTLARNLLQQGVLGPESGESEVSSSGEPRPQATGRGIATGANSTPLQPPIRALPGEAARESPAHLPSAREARTTRRTSRLPGPRPGPG